MKGSLGVTILLYRRNLYCSSQASVGLVSVIFQLHVRCIMPPDLIKKAYLEANAIAQNVIRHLVRVNRFMS